MITFKEYLNEDAGDRAAQKDREWLAQKTKLADDVGRALDASVRTAHNLNHITSAKWWSTTAKSNNVRLALNKLSPPLRNAAIVFYLDVKDARPLTLPSALSKDGLPFDAAVIVEPVNGDLIAVPSLRQPLKSTFSNGRGAAAAGKLANMFRIDKVVKAATQNLVFYARNHHKTKRG